MDHQILLEISQKLSRLDEKIESITLRINESQLNTREDIAEIRGQIKSIKLEVDELKLSQSRSTGLRDGLKYIIGIAGGALGVLATLKALGLI